MNKRYHIEVDCKWSSIDGTYQMEVFANNLEEAMMEVDHISEHLDFMSEPDETEVLKITQMENTDNG